MRLRSVIIPTDKEVLAMLVLTRHTSERIRIGDDIVLTLVRIEGRRVRIGIEAPPHVRIMREELELTVDCRGSPRRQSSGR